MMASSCAIDNDDIEDDDDNIDDDSDESRITNHKYK